jgi:hypothetical protein
LPARSRLRSDRELAETDAVGFEDDDAALAEIVLDRVEVGEQKRDLFFRSAIGAAAEEHERGEALAAEGEQSAEIGVGRDENALLLLRALEDLLVSCGLHPVVADVGSVVPGIGQAPRHHRRERVVDEEPQPAASGSSRSSIASAA